MPPAGSSKSDFHRSRKLVEPPASHPAREPFFGFRSGSRRPDPMRGFVRLDPTGGFGYHNSFGKNLRELLVARC